MLFFFSATALHAQQAVPVNPASHWIPMPLLSPEARAAGLSPGGEGGQWPRGGVEVSRSDPNFLLLPIDVGGLYRSVNGAGRWEIAMNGWHARGANGFAIDPRNASHVLGIGGNSLDWNEAWGQSPHGIYLSNDKAKTWKQTLAIPDGLSGSIVFDPSSYDAAKQQCQVAYYSTYGRGLFRSADGGATWQAVSRLPMEIKNEARDAPIVRVHPANGAVYLAGKSGLYRSTDGGKTFAQTYNGGAVWGLSVSEATPDNVWISGSAGVLRSADGGRTFGALAAQGIERAADEPVRNVTVSPADPQRMLCWVQGANWKWVRYISHDSGSTFRPIKIEKGLAPLPFNVRNGYFGWHPTDANVVYGLGGDWVTKSTDGGQTFHYANNGYNGVMLGDAFNFSSHEPNTVFLAFQDYNGAFTTDGGATWNYRDVSGKGWGGYCYAGHAVDKNVMWYGDAESWGGKRRLRISRDGGTTWNFVKDAAGQEIVFAGAGVSFSDPKHGNVLFASNWRSADKGISWQPMNGCDGVYIAGADGRLIGRDKNAIVVSIDSGVTWQSIAEVPGGFGDVAYDQKRDRFYVASQERLKYFERASGQR
jgi:hypothetical protein